MRVSTRWLVLGLVACMTTAASADQSTLRDIRLSAAGDKTRIVFDLGAPTEPDLFLLDHPDRLVVDLPDARAAAAVARDLAGGGIVERLRTGIRHGDDLRVVLDLKKQVVPNSFMLAPDGDNAYRLVVDLPGGDAEPRPRAATERRASTRANSARTAQPAAGTTPAREPETPEKKRGPIIIAIDAGHGGKDPGAHGPGGTREKDITLAIARRLAASVDDQANMRAVLTRRDDRYVGLRRRTVEARRDKADLFISIHADAAPGGARASGASVYALSARGATSEHARWLAKRENAADLVGGVSLKNKNDSLASFMLDLSQSASIEASLDAGKRVLAQLDHLGPLHKAKVQQARFVVLKSPDIPSFLVETAFISDPRGERKLRSAGYQKKLARAMLRGIKGYFASYRPATLIAKGQTHEVTRGETLSGIAQRYGVNTARLRRYNHLGGNTIRVGSRLRIPPVGQQVAGLE